MKVWTCLSAFARQHYAVCSPGDAGKADSLRRTEGPGSARHKLRFLLAWRRV